MQETGAVDIQWQSNWTLRSYHAALKGLLRICRQNASTVDLEGIATWFAVSTFLLTFFSKWCWWEMLILL